MTRDRKFTTAQRMWLVAAIAVLLCGTIVFGRSTQDYLHATMRREQAVAFMDLVLWPAVWWSGWVLLAPFVFELGWRCRLTRETWLKPILILTAGCLAAFVLHVSWQVASMALPRFSEVHPDLTDAIEYHVITSFYLNIFIYWVIVGGAQAIKRYRLAQVKALRASELEAELTRARLDSLKSQLHPHFLFNTLNGIATLMYRDVGLADRMVTRLSNLLRRALDRADVHELPLREEIELLEEYLSIEQLRFGGQLRVHFDIEEDIGDFLVPSFVYQPLVENSIKHAITPQGNSGTITIRAAREGDSLRLRVVDDGPGLEAGKDVMFGGVGLSNLYDRLDRLYGDAFVLDLHEVQPTGLGVEVTLPVRRSSHTNGARPGTPRVVTSLHP